MFYTLRTAPFIRTSMSRNAPLTRVMPHRCLTKRDLFMIRRDVCGTILSLPCGAMGGRGMDSLRTMRENASHVSQRSFCLSSDRR